MIKAELLHNQIEDNSKPEIEQITNFSNEIPISQKKRKTVNIELSDSSQNEGRTVWPSKRRRQSSLKT
jgi:hypothetical protein